MLIPGSWRIWKAETDCSAKTWHVGYINRELGEYTWTYNHANGFVYSNESIWLTIYSSYVVLDHTNNILRKVCTYTRWMHNSNLRLETEYDLGIKRDFVKLVLIVYLGNQTMLHSQIWPFRCIYWIFIGYISCSTQFSNISTCCSTK